MLDKLSKQILSKILQKKKKVDSGTSGTDAGPAPCCFPPIHSGSASIEAEQKFNALTAPDARAGHTYCKEETQDQMLNCHTELTLKFECSNFVSIHTVRSLKESVIGPAV